jgi:hypothetical protein
MATLELDVMMIVELMVKAHCGPTCGIGWNDSGIGKP